MNWLSRLAPGGLLVLILAGLWLASGGALPSSSTSKTSPAKPPELDRAAAIVAQIGKARGDILEAVQTSSDRVTRDHEYTARVVIAGVEQVRVDLREMQADLNRQLTELRTKPKPPPRRRAKAPPAPKPVTNLAWPYTITYATGHGRPRA